MKKFILAIMLSFGLIGLVQAFQLEYKTDNLVIFLDTKSPCSEKVMSLFTEEVKQLPWVGAEVTYNGHKLVACAAPNPQGGKPSVLIMDEQGDGGFIPAENFKAVTQL